MTWRFSLAILWALTFYSPAESSAQEKTSDPWIGQRVFKRLGTVLQTKAHVNHDEGQTTSGNPVGQDSNVFHMYRVEQVDGEWLRLRAENSGVAGWARANDVIPYDQAVDNLTKQIRSDPRAALFTYRGNIRSARQEYDLAIADYTEAIRLDPESASAYYNRGNSWYDKHNNDQAISDHTEAIRLDPKKCHGLLPPRPHFESEAAVRSGDQRFHRSDSP